MIKIRAITDSKQQKQSSQFSTSKNRLITPDDLRRLRDFSKIYLYEGREVHITYEVTFDNKGCIAGIKGKVRILNLSKLDQVFDKIIEDVNRYVASDNHSGFYHFKANV